MEKIIRTKNFLLDIAVNGLVLYGVFLMLSFAFYTFIPASWLFDYSSVSFVEHHDDELLMTSVLSIRIGGNMSWNDVLRCREVGGDRFVYYSQMDTSSEHVLTSGNDTVVTWFYRAPLPQDIRECRIDSVITRELPFGVKKQQFLSSEVFILNP